jgi:hypothetical protein
MPISRSTLPLRSMLVALGLLAVAASRLNATPAGVAVLRDAPWSPGDTAREGAGEFEVLICAAKLQRDHRAAGIVGVGNRHGMFVNSAERALRHLALRGFPIAKLAQGGDVAADPDQLFIDARGLNENDAASVLARCLERHGTPPKSVNPERPTARELAAIRKHLQPFREAFAVAASPRVALK